MIKASARKRAKTTRDRAETAIKRPGEGGPGNRGHDRRQMRLSAPAEAMVHISE
jgi:hypothetical protein